MKKTLFAATLSALLVSPSVATAQLGGLLGGQSTTQSGAAGQVGGTGQLGGQSGGTLRGALENGIRGGLQGAAQGSANGGTVGQAMQQGLNNAVQSGVQGALNGNAQYNNNSINGQANVGLNDSIRSSLMNNLRLGDDGSVRLNDSLNAPLQQFGLQANDQILNADGQPMTSMDAVQAALNGNGQFQVRRNGEIVSLGGSSTAAMSQTSGLTFERKGNTLFISEVQSQSAAEQARLRVGDQIVTVNGQAVSSDGEFQRLIQANNSDNEVIFLRDGTRYRATIKTMQSKSSTSANRQTIEQKLQTIERLLSEIRMELRNNQ